VRITAVDTVVTCPGRNFVLVKITTDAGLVGWGDATLNGRELAVAACLSEHLAPLLVGEDARRIEHHWNAIYTGAYWRGGPVQNTALAGIDMALWDLLGKHAGLPVYQLLGGRVRDGALAYTHVAGKTPDDVVAAVRQRMDRGFKAVRINLELSAGAMYGEKLKAGLVPPTVPGTPPGSGTPLLIQNDLPRVGVFEPTPYMRSLPKLFAHVRDALGDSVELLHDVHHRLSPIQAAQLARELEAYHPFFFEDPIAPEYAAGLGTIRQTSSIPIAIGEGFFDVSVCVPLITARLLDYLRCDLGHIGGITPARKLAAMSEPFCIKSAWHGPPDLSPVGHAANVHVDLAIPNFGIQEWWNHAADPTMAATAEVFRGGVIVRDGHLDVPETPGLGVDVDEAAARKYPYQRAYLPVVRLHDGSVHPW
jgi:mannonate dehydratase